MRKSIAPLLLVGASVLAMRPAYAQQAPAAAGPQETLATTAPQAAPADSAPKEVTADVVVTGSRVITNGNNSPTPVTALSAESLAQSKPLTIFESLLDQPLIAADKGGKAAGATGQGGSNNSIAAVNLRGLGPTRGLVLLDGRRVAPQNLDATVDLNQIPQLLIKRIDLQTGGSSAVYGSDAIAGVVNFIIDRKFEGLKVNVQGGIAQRGDDPTADGGIAWGKGFADGSGHFEASAEYRYDDGLLRTSRPNLQRPGGAIYALYGNGTTAPYFVSNQVVDGNATFGGLINSTAANPFNRYDFTQNGIATPFVNGTAIPGSTSQIGGNGGLRDEAVSLIAQNKFLQTFARADYDITPHVHFFVMGYYTKILQYTQLFNLRSVGVSANNGLATGFKILPSNAFLPSNISTAMVNANIASFNLGKYFAQANAPVSSTNFTSQAYNVTTGFDGQIGKYNWNVSYVGSRIVQASLANNTWDTGRLLAALDSVNVNGTPTCWVNTQPQYTANFPGCVPLNPFGPTSLTPTQLAYVLKPTHYVGTTSSYDFSAGISGSPISTWAGPVSVAVTGEYRKLGYVLTSDGPPANIVALDCNALGLLPSRTSCVQQTSTNIGTSTTFANGTAPRPYVSQQVGEVAGEIDVPLLSNLSFAKDLRANGAVRYAGYTSNGAVNFGAPYTEAKFHATTWKVGLDWQVNDLITIRATHSRDFRAPNLSDLYTPGRVQGLPTGTDFLTGAVVGKNGYTLSQQIGGNPNLQPEVGMTTTAGVVIRPAPRLSFAIDGYFIKISNAIVTVDGSNQSVQQACYDSRGSSPFCTLQARPGSFTDMSATNAATLFYTAAPLNIAQLKTDGVDFEGNWGTRVFGRNFAVRLLASYQPTLKSIQPLTVTQDAAGVSVPKLRLQALFNYNITDKLRIDWSTRWRSHLANIDPLLLSAQNLQIVPGSLNVPSASFSNVNFSYQPRQHVELFLNIQNVFDKTPPVYAPVTTSSLAGQGVAFYPSDDAIGRYFIMGARLKF